MAEEGPAPKIVRTIFGGKVTLGDVGFERSTNERRYYAVRFRDVNDKPICTMCDVPATDVLSAVEMIRRYVAGSPIHLAQVSRAIAIEAWQQ